MNYKKNSILRRIRAKKHGWVFTPKNFIDIASRNIIDTTLHRLVKKGIIRKLSRGIYDFPNQHPKLGTLAPNPDSIAKALAAKSGDIIQPSGARLANLLGLDTQVPAKPTYITSGEPIKKQIANFPITLTHSKFLNNLKLSANALNVIAALRHIGKNNITPGIIDQCKNILSKKDIAHLSKHFAKFPDWLVKIIIKIRENKNE